ncbi:hypothetical protein EHW64_18750 [Erwinia psidii]|uniref:TcpQ domain-containing protein n=1 Tax=Erwinia psidii TaxID=69224 RepID=UPI00226B99DC|nr:TcpQ domain-containing protein [Erwinia psidii]MCX8963097.1 hypothetical protein [Erwinia psidii]
MINNRFIISGLIINSLAACSSPMELPQPNGDWVDFVTPSVRPAPSRDTDSNKTSTTKVRQYAGNTSVYPSVLAKPAAAADKDRLVTASGKNVSLYSAVRTIVPPAWAVKLSPDVSAKFRGSLSWTGNDQWPYVLRKSLNDAALTPVIDERHKEVTVIFAAPVKSEASKVSPDVLAKNNAKTTRKILNGGTLTPPVVPVVTSPFKQPVVMKAPLLKPVVVAPPTPVKPALRLWTIAKGSTLSKAYEKWASGETCSGQSGKWSVRWDSGTDYPIDYPLTFTAPDFETATSQLFNLYQHAQVPLFVNGFRQQCLIVISDRK